MTSYLAYGLDQNNHGQSVHVIVDGQDHEDVCAKMQQTFGDRYCMISVENIGSDKTVPEAAKNVLFMSEKELYAAAPDLNPRRRRR
jgi:hypothetical protein